MFSLPGVSSSQDNASHTKPTAVQLSGLWHRTVWKTGNLGVPVLSHSLLTGIKQTATSMLTRCAQQPDPRKTPVKPSLLPPPPPQQVTAHTLTALPPQGLHGGKERATIRSSVPQPSRAKTGVRPPMPSGLGDFLGTPRLWKEELEMSFLKRHIFKR